RPTSGRTSSPPSRRSGTSSGASSRASVGSLPRNALPPSPAPPPRAVGAAAPPNPPLGCPPNRRTWELGQPRPPRASPVPPPSPPRLRRPPPSPPTPRRSAPRPRASADPPPDPRPPRSGGARAMSADSNRGGKGGPSDLLGSLPGDGRRHGAGYRGADRLATRGKAPGSGTETQGAEGRRTARATGELLVRHAHPRDGAGVQGDSQPAVQEGAPR